MSADFEKQKQQKPLNVAAFDLAFDALGGSELSRDFPFRITLKPELHEFLLTQNIKFPQEHVESHLRKTLRIGDLIERLSEMLQLDLSGLKFPLELNAKKDYHSAELSYALRPEDINAYKPGETLPWAVSDYKRINFSWDTFVNPELDMEEILIHELIHYCTDDMPLSDFLREGVAQAGGLLYQDLYPSTEKHSFYDNLVRNPSFTVLKGPENFGLNIGALPQNNDPILGSLIQRISGRILYDALGNTLEEKQKHFSHLVKNSSRLRTPLKNPDSVIKLPTPENWLSDISKFIPGFKERIESSPLYAQPICDTNMLIWLGSANPLTGNDCGTIYTFNYEKNENFFLINKKEGQVPEFSDIDFSYGISRELPLRVCFKRNGMVIEFGTKLGKIDFCPDSLVAILNSIKDDNMRKQGFECCSKPFRIEVSQTKGEWIKLGDNFSLEEYGV
jgi:hypothetical protein